jgi:tetratricopeptide (TPR) repeat protein
MKFSLFRKRVTTLATALLFVAALAIPSLAQSQYGAPQQQQTPPENNNGNNQSQSQQKPPEPPKLNPKEEADYKALSAVPENDKSTVDKNIQMSQQFLQKYPGSRYEEIVMNRLVSAYYLKQDWNDLYAEADKAVAKDPDDVDVLTVVGWVIPHLYNHDDPDAEKKLDKAENYEKHAIDVIPTIPKPDSMTDEQFAQAKSDKLSQAHSGLGLVYFRQQDFPNSVKELQLATTGASSPDPTDLYALGVGLMQTDHNNDASDAFAKCAAIPGGLQDRCKQMAAQAKGAK